MRVHYWSHSRFANWIRRISGAPTPLDSGTSTEWREYNKKQIAHSPFVKYITDDLFNIIQDLFYFPYDITHKFFYWLNKRYIRPSHIIPCGLKRGEWHESETKLLHGMFSELVDFVEHQKASMAWHGKSDYAKANDKFVPWTQKFFPTRLLTNWQSEHYGVQHLLWEISLTQDESWGYDKDSPEYGKPTRQAESAATILDLYVWWKYLRPMRPDPYEESGWSAYCAASRTEDSWLFDDKTPEEQAISKVLLDNLHGLEALHEKEDTDNMIRLIQIRNSLWT